MTVFEPDLRRIIQPTDDEFTDFPFYKLFNTVFCSDLRA